MSEDCLYLNIWTGTSNHSQNTDKPLKMLESSAVFGPKEGRPVMIWIHGGNLIRGSASLEIYNGMYLAAKVKNVLFNLFK